MRKCGSECVGCKSFGLPCMADCPNKNVVRLFCDLCMQEAQELFSLENGEVCEDCLLLYAAEKKCDRCGKTPYESLYDYEGECLCEECLKTATKIDIVEQ